MSPWNWVLTHAFQESGSSSSSSRAYNFWSGIGGANVGVFAGIAVYLRHKNCHTKGCWRIGHPNADGVVVCRKHT